MVYALHLPTPRTPEGDRAALQFLLDRLPGPDERDAGERDELTLGRLARQFPTL